MQTALPAEVVGLTVHEKFLLQNRVDVRQNAVLEVGRGHEWVLREVQQERHNFADLLHVQLVLKQVVHAVHEHLLLLNYRVRDLLKRQKYHVVAFGEEGVDEIKELSFYLLLELRPD